LKEKLKVPQIEKMNAASDLFTSPPKSVRVGLVSSETLEDQAKQKLHSIREYSDDSSS